MSPIVFLGIASPNKRPTLFDVFRRKGSDGSKKEKDVVKVAGSDRDSTSSAGSGGIMNSMKQAIMSGKSAEAPESNSKKAVKDGSAHPHAGSDARVRLRNVSALRNSDYRLSSVLSHRDGCKTIRRRPFADAQGDGSLQASLQLSSLRGGQAQSGEFSVPLCNFSKHRATSSSRVPHNLLVQVD